MKRQRIFAAILIMVILSSLAGCAMPELRYDMTSSLTSSDTSSLVEMPNIFSLDKKMANYLDISLFDEENYSNIYLGKSFKYDVSYNEKEITVPTTLEVLTESGYSIVEGSEYDENSYIYANETITLKFTDETSSFTAVFYNSSKSSVRLNKCKIAKIRFENGRDATKFSINGLSNNSTVTDVIDTLGTPSHFYAITDDNYYFDYFILRSDRRNKIRVYLDLINDCITAVEFSYYK